MTRIAINGFGRIGRMLTRAIQGNEHIELVAINDLTDKETLAHLLKYDSVHRGFNGNIELTDTGFRIDGKEVVCLSQKDPATLPWAQLNVDVVVESTGMFRTEEKASLHLEAGSRRVIISAPPKDGNVKSVVMGINDMILDGSEQVISNASCTTNCAAPMVKVLDEMCGIQSGYITTIHSYTGDQRLHDAPHTDLRRARAAAVSIVPTTTGAAKAITRIFPHLDGKMGGCGIRVPVPNGSLTDITCIVNNAVSEEEVNRAFQQAASAGMSNILQYTSDPIVSVDIVGNPYSCIFDAGLTSVIGNMVKVVGWYDNEAGYSNRLVDLIEKIS